MRLHNKVAIITGAGAGIGRAGALRFAAEGALIAVSDVDGDAAQETADLVKKQGGRAIAMVSDVSSEYDSAALVKATVDEYGQLDILWANAGIPQAWRTTEDTKVDEFDRLMAVNARGPWLSARAAIGHLRKRPGAAVVFTGSASGIRARADFSAYQSSKGAVVMLTRSLAREFARDGVRVNAVCPSAVTTQMWGQFIATADDTEAVKRQAAEAVPLGRVATAEDVANAALFLASDEASFITGVNLPVDGGSLI